MRLLALFCLLILLGSCQNDTPSDQQENTSKRFVDFYLRYLDSERMLKVEATFSEGMDEKTATTIDFENGVQFLDQKMALRKVRQQIHRYSYDNLADYPTNGTFPFAWESEKYELKMSPIDNFQIIQASISSGIQINLAKVLDKEESLICLLNDVQNNSISIPMTIEGTTANAPLSDYSENLTTGKAEIYLVKKQIKSATVNAYQIKSMIEYYSKNTSIELME